MLVYKTEEEIDILRRNNLLVSKTLAEVAKLIKPGVTTLELDKRAEEFIRDNGAVPGFLGYGGYPNTLCTSINDEVVHGIPSNRVLKNGDIVSVDCGTFMEGFYGDTAYTFPVGEVKDDVMNLIKTTKESLFKGIENAIDGLRIGDVGSAVQFHGHGLGRDMHESPEVPNYGKRGRGIKLATGLVICIEPMINMGSKYIKQDNDGWTIRTIDGKPSAHFELAIVVRKEKAEILSTFKYIEEVKNFGI